MRPYHSMSEEKRSEVRRKNAQMQKKWKQKMKMKDEGTYEVYKQRLNVRRRELQAEKKRALGVEWWKALTSVWNRFGVNIGNGWTSNWTVPFPYRGCPWTGPTPSLRRTGRKPFVLMRYNKWTTICKNKMSLLKQVYCAIKQGCRTAIHGQGVDLRLAFSGR